MEISESGVVLSMSSDYIGRTGTPLLKVADGGVVIDVDVVEKEIYNINYNGALNDGRYFGELLGSTIGGIIGGENVIRNLIGRSIFSIIGGRLGSAVAGAIFKSDFSELVKVASSGGFAELGNELKNSLQSSAIGTVSSFLTIEISDALGLDGAPGQVFGNVVGSLLQHAANNAVAGRQVLSGLSNIDSIFETDPSSIGPGTLAVSAVATFLGNRLGSLVVSPQTSAGVVLANLGSAAGAYAFSAAGFSWGSTLLSGVFGNGFIATNFIFPGVGAFVGFVLGGLIGNLFGRKKPKVPAANAETVLNYNQGLYQLGAVTVTNNGNRGLVESMALQARDILNGLVQTIAGDLNPAWIVSSASPTQTYGHTGAQIWAKYNGVQTNFSDAKGDAAASAVEWGTLKAARDTLIAGGDMIAKRALYYSPSDTLTTLMGDLQIASDYSFYLRNREQINAQILAPWNSLSEADKNLYKANEAAFTRLLARNDIAPLASDWAAYGTNPAAFDRIVAALEKTTQFDAGWMVTLQRAAELNLDQWRPSDFYGGLRGLFDSFNLLELGIGYEQVGMSLIGTEFTFSLPSTVMAGVFAGIPTASADGRSFTVGNFGAAIGYNMIGGNPAGVTRGNDFANGYGLAGVVFDDLRNGVSGGDDIFLGSSGADTLRGQAGHDWLQGYDGNDVLEGGDGNDVLLGGQHEDRLYGGNGDDYLFGGEGWDHPQTYGDSGLHGGAGNDILVLNRTGPTAAWGDEGDDLFIMAEDNDYDYVNGGDGRDTISFERFTTVNSIPFNGVTVTLAPMVFADAIVSIENVTGSRLNDFITGDAGGNLLRGLTGDDRLDGLDGNDTLDGGVGADTLNGSTGIDTLSYERSSAAVYVDFQLGIASGGDAVGDVWNSVENLRGSYYDDILGGDNFVNRIEGLRGNDVLIASAGNDTLDGGDGFDTADYQNFINGVTVNLATSTSTLISIEHLSGSRFADNLTGDAGDNVLTGAGGNDTLNGGDGSDTYMFSLGHGSDTITDNNLNANKLLFSDLTWSDLALGTPNGELVLGVRGTTDQMRVVSNFAASGNGIIKEVDMGGGNSLEIGHITFAWGGGDQADSGIGRTNLADLMFGYNGADYISGAATGQVESTSNVIVGGFGNDYVVTSNGDDWFGFDRGDGQDIIIDSGGEDTLVFGPNTAAKDVIFHIDQHGDMWIGIRDLANPQLKANEVADHVMIVGGGIIDSGQVNGAGKHTVEYVKAGGTTISVINLDLNWQFAGNGTPLLAPVLPIVFDLAGDGVNLSTVAESRVVTRTESGALIRMGWVGPADGILALDRNGDGQINQLSEISFVDDLEGATSDLEGLAAYDSNNDGILDAKDARFGEFRLWIDKNQNGRSSSLELQTLTEAGIQSINLKGQKTGMTGDNVSESYVIGTTSFNYANGKSGTAHDVALARRFINDIGNGLAVVPESMKGAGNENAVLGYLKADPIQLALAENLGASLQGVGTESIKPPKTGSGQKFDYNQVAKLAQLDFSDHDILSAHDAAIWADQLSGKPVVTLADGINDAEAEKRWRQVMSVSADGARKADTRRASAPMGVTVIAAKLDADRDADQVREIQDDVASRIGISQDALSAPISSDTGTGMEDQRQLAAAEVAIEGTPAADHGQVPWYLLDAHQSDHAGLLSSILPAAADIGVVVSNPVARDGSDRVTVPSIEHQRLNQALAAFRGSSGVAPVRTTDPMRDQMVDLVTVPLIKRLPTAKSAAA